MKYFALLFFWFCTCTTFAQKRDTSYYYTDFTNNSTDKDKALYIFKAYQTDSGWVLSKSDRKNLLIQVETYADSQLRELSGPYFEYTNGRLSLSGSFKENKKHGIFKTFDKDGNLLTTATYYLDSIRGKYLEYYPSGHVKEERLYEKSRPVSKIVYNDNGTIREKITYDEKGQMLTRMQYYPGNKLGINERFINGKITEASYFDVNGNSTKPFKMETEPSFPGGMESFNNYLQNTLDYPKDAAGNVVKGSIDVSFTVTETGNLENIKINRGFSRNFDEEVIRVMKRSPNWTPGTQYGKAVRVKLNMPIRFTVR